MNQIINKKIKKNIKLSDYTTYKIGGPAQYFFEAETSKEIIDILNYCNTKKIKYFILGGGSNLLFSDQGYKGMVIKINNQNIKFNKNKAEIGAGASLQDIVFTAAQKGLSGIEYLAGIPGSLGGAIRGNAGAYGHDISEVVESAQIIINEKNKLVIKKLSRNQLKFAYRNSIIKDKEYILVSAFLKFKKSTKNKVQKIVKDIIQERNKKQPYDKPSAGCVFKNIEDSKNPSLKTFEVYGKVPIGRIIEELGMKGKNMGGAQVSDKHANFIINTGNAKAKDIINMIKQIKRKTKQRFGVSIDEEIKIVK